MSVLKAPFPWFGGKSKVADMVWIRLGDVRNYIEPFAGSVAVLLRRPVDHIGKVGRSKPGKPMAAMPTATLTTLTKTGNASGFRQRAFSRIQKPTFLKWQENMATKPTITFRPLDHATWQNDGRKLFENCRFRTPYSKTVDHLLGELGKMNVHQVVIEVDVPESQVRNDGMLYARASPSSPRVRISFKHPKVGHLQYPCDTYSDWKDNLRAIALTLEAQRAMDRYGATRHNQQYKGWAALPPSDGPTGVITMAAELIISKANSDYKPSDLLGDPEVFKTLYRAAARQCHPDTGGNNELFNKLQLAKQIIDKHFGGGA